MSTQETSPSPSDLNQVAPNAQYGQVPKGSHDTYDQANPVPNQPYQWHPYFHPPYPHQSQPSQTYPTNTYQHQPPHPQAYDPHLFQATPTQMYQGQAYPPPTPRAFEPQTYQHQPSRGFGTAPGPQWSPRATDPHLQRKVNQLELDKRRSERKAQKQREEIDKAEARAARLEREAQKRTSKRRHDRSEMREMKETMNSLNQRIMELQLDRLEVGRAQRMFPDHSLRDLRSLQRETHDISSDTNVGSDSLQDDLIEWLTRRKRQEQRRLITEREMDDSLLGSDSRGLQVGPQPTHDTLDPRLLKKMVQSALFDLLEQSDRASTLGAHADDLGRQFDNRIKEKPRDYEAEASKMHKTEKELFEAARHPDDDASESLHETSESESEPSSSGLQRHNIRARRSSPQPEKKVAMHERRGPRTSKRSFHPPDDSGYGSVIDRNSNRTRVSEFRNLQSLGTGLPKRTRHDRPVKQAPTHSNMKKPKRYQNASVRDAHESDYSSEGSDSAPMVPERKRAPYCKRPPPVEAPDPPSFSR